MGRVIKPRELRRHLRRSRWDENATAGFRDKLAGYWPLDEAGTGTRFDRGGNGNHLTNVNGATQAAGQVGFATSFVAASSQRLTSTSSAFNFGDVDFAFSVWVRPASLVNGQQILSKDNLSNRDYALYANSTGSVDWFVGNGAGSVVGIVTAPAASLAVNTWANIICWHSAALNQVGIAIKGGTAVTASTSAAAGNGAASFIVGFGPGNFWDGRLDELAAWKRVPPATERTAICQRGLDGLPLI